MSIEEANSINDLGTIEDMLRDRENLKLLSYSQMRKFQECRYDWYKHYVEGIRPRDIEAPRLHRGTLVHAGLECAFLHHYNGTDWRADDYQHIVEAIGKVHDEYIEELGEHIPEGYAEEAEELCQLAIELTVNALEWLNLDRYEVVACKIDGKLTPLVETALIIPVQVNGYDGLLLYCDVVLREKSTGNVFLFDHKVRDALQTYENEETNTQFPIYQKALDYFGIDLSGVATFQIRAKVPAIPELTKKGELSRKKMATTWEIYLDAIKACGFDPADYEGVKEWATKVEFFRLTKNYASPTQVENIWANQMAIAIDMANPNTIVYRNLRPGFGGCHNCKNRLLCLTELRGGDTAWVLKNKYRHRTEDNVLLPLVEDLDFNVDA